MQEKVKQKSVGLPEPLIRQIKEKAQKESRSFSNTLAILASRQLEQEKSLSNQK